MSCCCYWRQSTLASHLIHDGLPYLLDVTVTCPGLNELIWSKALQLNILLPFLNLLANSADFKPGLLRLNSYLPDFKHSVALRRFQGLDYSTVHVPEDQVRHRFQLLRDHAQEDTGIYLSHVGLSVIVIQNFKALLDDIPNIVCDILEPRMVDDDTHALNELRVLTFSFLYM